VVAPLRGLVGIASDCLGNPARPPIPAELPILRGHGPSLAPRSQARLYGKFASSGGIRSTPLPESRRASRPWHQGTAAAQHSASYADIDAIAEPAASLTWQSPLPALPTPRLPWRAEPGNSTQSARHGHSPTPSHGPLPARNHGRFQARCQKRDPGHGHADHEPPKRPLQVVSVRRSRAIPSLVLMRHRRFLSGCELW
jgi:hypothetical protein